MVRDDRTEVRDDRTEVRRTGPATVPATPARRISWGAVLAGGVIALVVQLTLALLGLGIGFGTIDPAQGDTPGASSLAIGAVIWWVVSALIALFLGGWVAGRLAGVPRRLDGALHGALTWGIATLVAVWLVSSAIATVIGGAFNVVQAGVSAAGQGAAALVGEVGGAAPGLDAVRKEARQLLRDTGVPALQPGALEQRAGEMADTAASAAAAAARNPQQAEEELMAGVERLAAQGSEVASQADRDAVVNILMARTDMGRAEAERTVDSWVATARQAGQQLAGAAETVGETAVTAADRAAGMASQAALWTFVMLILSLAAAVGGGLVGSPRRLPEHQLPPTPDRERHPGHREMAWSEG